MVSLINGVWLFTTLKLIGQSYVSSRQQDDNTGSDPDVPEGSRTSRTGVAGSNLAQAKALVEHIFEIADLTQRWSRSW